MLLMEWRSKLIFYEYEKQTVLTLLIQLLTPVENMGWLKCSDIRNSYLVNSPVFKVFSRNCQFITGGADNKIPLTELIAFAKKYKHSFD